MKNKVITILFCLTIIILDIIFLASKKESYSKNENRYLTEFPKLNIENIKSGKYMNELTDYLKDHFSFRNEFMSIKTFTEKLEQKTKINGVYLAKDNYLIEDYKNIKDKDKLVRAFNRINDNTNINFNLILVPTSISINNDKLPLFSNNGNQIEDIEYIYKNINFHSINLYDDLKKENENEQMFYKLDHHWTSHGALTAYQTIMKDFGEIYAKKENFKVKKATDNFYGTLYSKVLDNSKKPDEIYTYNYNNNLKIEYKDTKTTSNSLYDYSYLYEKDKYSLFLSNNHSLIVITNNEIDTEKELVIIKDSYANSLIPFLVYHYKKIHVIDPRYYHEKISDYINQNNIQDGLIIYNMSTIEDDIGVYTIE